MSLVALPPSALLDRVLARDPQAWQQFQAAVEPTLVTFARKHRDLRTRGLAKLPDDVREVTLKAFERLSRSDFHNLRQFDARAAATPDRTEALTRWLRYTVDYVVRDHLRQRYGRAPTTSANVAPQPSKREPHTFAERIDMIGDGQAFSYTLGMTTKLRANEIWAYVEEEFTDQEAEALRLHLQGCSTTDIKEKLQLSREEDAQRMVHRLKQRLRDQFAEEA